ncbi:MAG: hypothetical protein IPO21_20300, partial [Bacteroidales bacterium]|nr:hypothetical protein [Bacteroidales bacterium]
CTATDQIEVIVKPSPTVNLGADKEFCLGDQALIDATTVNASYLWNTGETSSTISVNSTGTYSVTVSVDNCNATDQIEVNVNPLPTVNLGADKVICDGEFAVLDATTANASYLWYTGETSSTISVNSTGTYNVTVSVGNCTATDQIEVYVNPSPTVSLGADKEICQGEQAILDATTANASYLWNTGETSSTISVSNSGTYSVTVSVGNCTATDQIEVNVNPLPTVNLGADKVICDGEFAVLDATTANASYLWSNGVASPDISVNKTGTYIVTVSVGNCTATDQIEVNVNPLPSVNLGADKEICEGELTPLNAANYSNASYLWNNGATSSSITVFITGTYSVTVSIDNCTATDDIEVNVNPLPTVSLGADIEICEGEQALLNATSANATYLWNTGETSSVISVNNAGTYIVTVSVDNCTAIDEIDVNVNPIPSVNLGADKEICEGEEVVLDATTTNVSYLWNTGETSSVISVNNAGTYRVTLFAGNCTVTDQIEVNVNPLPTVNLGADKEICQGELALLDATTTNASFLWNNGKTNSTISVNSAGTYSVTVSVDNCTASDDINVLVKSSTSVDLGANKEICEGKTTILSTDITGTYRWSNNKTTAQNEVSNQGWYYLSVTNNNCTSVDSVFVKINPKPTPPSVTNVTSCIGEKVVLKASGESLRWYSDETLNQFLFQTSEFEPTYTLPNQYRYYITQTINNCESSPSVLTYGIYQPQNDNIKIIGKDEVCIDTIPESYNAISDNDVVWEINGNNFGFSEINSKSINIEWNSTGIDTLIAKSYDSNGCSISDSLIVYIADFPIADFITNVQTNEGNIYFENTSTSEAVSENNISKETTITSYWDFDYYLGKHSEPGFEFEYQAYKDFNKTNQYSYDYGNYKVMLIAENNFGCKDTIIQSVFMDVFVSLYVPSAFAPNNFAEEVREFRPKGMNIKTYNVSVFDAWEI